MKKKIKKFVSLLSRDNNKTFRLHDKNNIGYLSCEIKIFLFMMRIEIVKASQTRHGVMT